MKRRVVVFCGGTGAGSLIRALSRSDAVELTILVNCYDDGLSTGKLRALIPGMLGPSDLRKNVRHSLLWEANQPAGGRAGRAAAFDRILAYRIPDVARASELQRRLPAILAQSGSMGELSHRQIAVLLDAVRRFLDYVVVREDDTSLYDVSLANMFFAGLYLKHQRFNDTVRAFVGYFGIDNRILNLTDGTDLKLVGLTQTNRLVADESAISCLQPHERILDVFLLDEYLSESERRALESVDASEKSSYLEARSRVPGINHEARAAISKADLVVYWPGTQHSSLFPSYLTHGLAEAIRDSAATRKVLVTNVLKDHDIHNETAFSLVEKFFWFMSRKSPQSFDAQGVVTDMLLNYPNSDGAVGLLPLGSPSGCYRGAAMHVKGWADPYGAHDIGKVLDSLALRTRYQSDGGQDSGGVGTPFRCEDGHFGESSQVR